MDIERTDFFKAINDVPIKKNEGDYFDGEVLICCKCNTPKSMIFPSKLENFKNKIVPIMCKCRTIEKNKEIAEEKQKKVENRINLLISKGIMDKSHLDYDISQDDKSNKKITNFCKRYLDNWDIVKNKNMGVIFSGDVGTGKTFYACCIAKELMKKGEKICITNFSRILNKYKSFEEEQTDIISMVYNSTLLVIDDFGIERRTEFANEKIFEFIDARIGSKLPTIITTNLTLKELQSQDLELKRIYSRIKKICPLKFIIDGEDRREAESKEIFKDFLKENDLDD